MSTNPEPVHPFAVKVMNNDCICCDADSRLARVKASTDVAWLRSVLAHRDTQRTVVLAAERRLRKLARERTRI